MFLGGLKSLLGQNFGFYYFGVSLGFGLLLGLFGVFGGEGESFVWFGLFA